MTSNVGSVPTLDAGHYLKTKHLDVPVASLVGTPASATATAVQALITAAVSAIVDGAPGALNTLRELATAIGSDPNYAADLATQLAGKASMLTIAGTVTS